jgi:hypothetical protein
MKAISLHQPYASMIASGKKTIETRRYRTRYRGDLLICSTKKPHEYYPGLPRGMALCVVTLCDCRPMSKKHEKQACCRKYEGAWSWFLQNIRKIKPFPVTGRQGFFNVELPKGENPA